MITFQIILDFSNKEKHWQLEMFYLLQKNALTLEKF